jgi:two-component system sensor kinase FixL
MGGIAFRCSLMSFEYGQTQETFVVNMLFPAIVFAQAAVIVWLLMSRTHRDSTASPSGAYGQPELSGQIAGEPGSSFREPRIHARAVARMVELFVRPDPPDMQRDPPAEFGRTDIKETLHRAAPGVHHVRHTPAGRRHMSTLRAFHRVLSDHHGSGSGSDNESITQERASHDSLVEGFRNLWQSLPLATFMLGSRGEVLAANARAESLFDYEDGEMIGKPVSLLVPEFDDPRSPLWCNGFPSASPDRPSEATRRVVARRKQGTEFPAEIVVRRSSFQEDTSTLAFVEDRSDHYELVRNQQDLAHLTRVSTMGELAGSLAHELNQPLTAILSNVQAAQRFMAADPIDVAEVRDILNDIVQDDYRASEVLRRIRATVKKVDMESAPLDLATVIRDAVLLLHTDAIVRETRVALEICDDVPAVCADKVQLQQVALNLLLNAFDAMSQVVPKDRVVSVELALQSEDMARIAVRDCGHGLTVGKLDAIFKPFYTSKPHGLGLGLSISRSIVELHGGRIWAENNLDRGATFYVTLPIGSDTGNQRSRC